MTGAFFFRPFLFLSFPPLSLSPRYLPRRYLRRLTQQRLLAGMFNLPGHTRPYLPANADLTTNPPLFFRPPVFGNVGPGAPLGSQARQSRRLYVGNIGMEATEEAIRAFFNNKMADMGMLSDGKLSEDLMGLGLKGDQPVISVHLNYEKNYAFVEVRLLSPLRLSFLY